MSRTLRDLTAFLVLLTLCSGCSKFFGSLRRDLDDGNSEPTAGPTVGGRWTEGGLLSEDGSDGSPYDSINHNDRSPASAADRASGGAWASGQSDANQRDQYRNSNPGEEQPMNSDNTPVYMPQTKRLYKNGGRATRGDFVDDSKNEGSLWASDGQTNYYFTKNKVRGIGDIVTITVEQDLFKDSMGEVKRTLSPAEKQQEVAMIQDQNNRDAQSGKDSQDQQDQVANSSAAANRTPAGAPAPSPSPAAAASTTKSGEAKIATIDDLDVSKYVNFKPTDTIMAEIVERYPNGNYKVRGSKKINYHQSQRLLTLVAIARGTDITEEDVVPSGKLYEYRLEVLR